MSYHGIACLPRAPLLMGAALCLVATAGAFAQAPPPSGNPSLATRAQVPSSTFKVQTKLITVDVVASDSHGAPVRGLKKEDFEISEEHNRAQQIVRFEFIDRAAN